MPSPHKLDSIALSGASAARRASPRPGLGRRQWKPKDHAWAGERLAYSQILHLAMIARVVATLNCLAPGQTFLGVGAGEALTSTLPPVSGQP